MHWRVPSIVAILCCAVVAGCGSSSSSTASAPAAGTPTRTAARPELSRLAKPLPLAGARLPAAAINPVVDRKYLTALFDDAQGTWRRDFAAAGLSYEPAHLVIFSGKTGSACGASDDSGPFYCPGDRTVYLDLRFFALLGSRFGLRAVAQAYIVGHEFAHHVQNLLGITHRVDVANHAQPSGRNGRSVRLELEADCLAGVWGRSAYSRASVTMSDLYSATKTAEVLGDDYLSRAAGNVIDSSQWTHGSSEQRQYWLRKGFRSDRPDACNTFSRS